MRALDTNILARWVLEDDVAQLGAAQRLLAEPAYVPMTVLVELGWVLRNVAGLSRPHVSAAIEAVLAIENVIVDDRDGIGWALERFVAGADWADMLHLVAVREGADRFATFDRRLARHAGADVPVRVETIESAG